MPDQPASTPPAPRRRRESGRRQRQRRRTALAAALVAALVAAVAGGLWWTQRDDEPEMAVEPGTYVAPSEISSPSSSSSSTSATKKPAKPKKKPTSSSSTSRGLTTDKPKATAPSPPGDPTRVQVTSGGRMIVDANLQATYLDSQKVLAPPFGTAGWYAEKGWPKPGHRGASIVVGHINHGSQPDVFWNLPQVKVGDLVTVTYGSGEQVKFRITQSRAASKTEVPRDDTIWDHDNPQPILRLITCDPTTPLRGGHYEGNWVVWADQLVG